MLSFGDVAATEDSVSFSLNRSATNSNESGNNFAGTYEYDRRLSPTYILSKVDSSRLQEERLRGELLQDVLSDLRLLKHQLDAEEWQYPPTIGSLPFD